MNLNFDYSIVKDSSADLGVNSKIVQIRPKVKAVFTKMSKTITDYGSFLEFQFPTVKSALLSLTIL